MAEINQFGSAKPIRSGEGVSCAECEAMLMDALDGVLSAKDKAAFELHVSTCAECSQMLADAKRGAVLLDMLKSPRPEPSSALLERILAQTSGARTIGALAGGFAVPAKSAVSGVIALPAVDGSLVASVAAVDNVIPFRPGPGSRFSFKTITQTMMQPRLAMTAAMAFFSITLTLNLTGVHLTDLRASDLTPSNLKHGFYHANASVVRYYTNLRVVYELESRVNEMKRTNEEDNPRATAKPEVKDGTDKDQDQSKPRKTPKSGSGTSQQRSPLDHELKLAGYGSNPVMDGPAGNNTAFSRRSHKLKETLQEGDLV